ncbi:MAG: alpha-glucosidase [Chloroflexi bacterium]|nr:alpha-glucosidase [Chloroflexota bacterium]
MSQQKWWQTAIFYQIYPRSFADGNGDGIGDFKGMTEKLDYLKGLGVDGLWLSPHFPSPNWDCGYDISDYENVAPEYGTLEDFKAFLHAAHARGMRLILDLVLNHTSDEHAWFLESKSSRDNPKADWYVWKDPLPASPISNPRNGGGVPKGRRGPPNNWQSCFDGPAWTYVPERGQYYYHYFMKQQPDLNWRNPEVKAAMWRAARFWLDMGVDGFRLDALGTIYEDPDLTPHTVPMTLAELRHFSDVATTPEEKKLAEKYWFDMYKNQWGGPGLHDLMQELRHVLDEYPGDRMLVGEDDNIDYMGNGDDELHMVFNFPLMRTERLTPDWVRANQTERLRRLDALPARGWGCNTLGNHDCSRVLTRYGDRVHDDQLARLHLALLMTMRGTPFLYNGEEIGMTDLVIPDPVKLRDTMATWYYDSLINKLKVEPALAAQRAGAMSRDKDRTPLQWRDAPNGGFCPEGVTPWLPVNPDYAAGVNVEAQENDPDSLLNFYRRMLKVRKDTSALVEGEYQAVHEKAEDYLAFRRSLPEQQVLVVLNFSGKKLVLDFTDLRSKPARTIYPSGNPAELSLAKINLEPFGILISELL